MQVILNGFALLLEYKILQWPILYLGLHYLWEVNLSFPFLISKKCMIYIKHQKDAPKHIGYIQIAPKSIINKREHKKQHPLLTRIQSRYKIVGVPIFLLVSIAWVMPSIVHETLLSQQGSFVGKKREKACRAAPLCFFKTIQEEGNIGSFENVEYLDLIIKNLFLRFFLYGARSFVDGESCMKE